MGSLGLHGLSHLPNRKVLISKFESTHIDLQINEMWLFKISDDIMDK